MIACGLVGAVVGLVLGARFKVLILVPVQMLALVMAATVALAGTIPPITAALGFAAFCAGLQFTYLAAVIAVIGMRGPALSADI